VCQFPKCRIRSCSRGYETPIADLCKKHIEAMKRSNGLDTTKQPKPGNEGVSL
jgi:hypothetical protein